MNKLITVLGVVGALAALTTSGFAQAAGPKGNGQKKPEVGGKRGPGAQGGPGMRGGMRAMQEVHKKVLAQLNLSPDQKKKIDVLDAKREKDMKALRDQMQGDPSKRQELRPKLRAIQETYRDGLMKILTPEQQKKHKELMEKAMKEWREKNGGGMQRAPKPGANRP